MNIRFICGLKMQNHKTEKPFGSPPLLWTGWGHVVPAPFLQFSRHSKKSCWISALESPLCIEIRLPCIHWNVGFAYGWVKGFVCGLCFVCGVIKSQLFFPLCDLFLCLLLWLGVPRNTRVPLWVPGGALGPSNGGFSSCVEQRCEEEGGHVVLLAPAAMLGWFKQLWELPAKRKRCHMWVHIFL